LANIERIHELALASHPGESGEADLVACILALDAVRHFLGVLVPCHTLTLLGTGLSELLVVGTSPAMFLPLSRAMGRRSDAAPVMAAKGILAAMMHAQQSAGMSRENAAKWIVRYTSPTLAGRISGKPLTPRMVEEWLDRYGGAFAESNAGRKSYLTWSRSDAVSAKRFRDITERLAKTFPVRKPR
jgi:hypothetical protein